MCGRGAEAAGDQSGGERGVSTIPLWVAIGGFAVPLLGLAGSAIAFVLRLYQDAAEKRRNRFFELMTYIDGSGPIAAKLAAVYALRDFKKHREFLRRFCTTQQSQVVGGNAEELIKELNRSEEHKSEHQKLMRKPYA